MATRVPLPSYRADLNDKHGRSERQITVSHDLHQHVSSLLASLILPSLSTPPFPSPRSLLCSAILPSSSPPIPSSSSHTDHFLPSSPGHDGPEAATTGLQAAGGAAASCAAEPGDCSRAR
ncbi:unnamed protein product [Closterium sp. Naga37s-1]|nr:unnamed protein product [Closterium sp. Naga37s-1]